MAISVIPTGAPVGAELRGIDLARKDIGDDTIEEVKQALGRHGMVFVRDQNLTPERQVSLSNLLGPPLAYDPNGPFRVPDHPEIVVLSNIYEDGKPIGVVEAGQYWHTDLSYLANPPSYAVLQAVEIPRDDRGRTVGGTIFTNTAHAFQTLPADIKAKILPLRARHSREVHRLSNVREVYSSEYDAPNQIFEQPVVRAHPRTGEKCLYVNETYTEALLGLDEAEGRSLLKFLCAHVTREEARYQHRWDDGDLLIWDDCLVQHFAINDYRLPQRRRMHRTSIAGPRPV